MAHAPVLTLPGASYYELVVDNGDTEERELFAQYPQAQAAFVGACSRRVFSATVWLHAPGYVSKRLNHYEET